MFAYILWLSCILNVYGIFFSSLVGFVQANSESVLIILIGKWFSYSSFLITEIYTMDQHSLCIQHQRIGRIEIRGCSKPLFSIKFFFLKIQRYTQLGMIQGTVLSSLGVIEGTPRSFSLCYGSHRGCKHSK